MPNLICAFDDHVIHAFRRLTFPLARIALFVIFFWFGILKLFYISPANPLVTDLLSQTLPFLTFDQFIIFLGFYEMATGLAFILPRFERVAILLMIPHIITTVMPLILLPAMTWQGALVPTLEGQYIIKNLLIVALAVGIAAHLHPMKPKHPRGHFKKS